MPTNSTVCITLRAGAQLAVVRSHAFCDKNVCGRSGVRRKFSWGGFIQWQMVVICICCALFVTSPFDVIFMSSSEVC